MAREAWAHDTRPINTRAEDRAFQVWYNKVEQLVQNAVGLPIQDVTRINMRGLWDADASADDAFRIICDKEGIEYADE